MQRHHGPWRPQDAVFCWISSDDPAQARRSYDRLCGCCNLRSFNPDALALRVSQLRLRRLLIQALCSCSYTASLPACISPVPPPAASSPSQPASIPHLFVPHGPAQFLAAPPRPRRGPRQHRGLRRRRPRAPAGARARPPSLQAHLSEHQRKQRRLPHLQV